MLYEEKEKLDSSPGILVMHISHVLCDVHRICLSLFHRKADRRLARNASNVSYNLAYNGVWQSVRVFGLYLRALSARLDYLFIG